MRARAAATTVAVGAVTTWMVTPWVALQPRTRTVVPAPRPAVGAIRRTPRVR